MAEHEVELRGVSVRYGDTFAVDGVDLTVAANTVLGLVGESGSGKSSLGRVIAGLLPPTTGSVLIKGSAARPKRGPHPAQLIFQDPSAALNPRQPIGRSIAEALQGSAKPGASERGSREAVAHYLELVDLSPDLAQALPREMSGGQRQRVTIARALAAQPRVLVADEITASLDVSVQGSVLNTLRSVQHQLRLTIVFISHDLAVVRYLADRVAVMQGGRVVEQGDTDALVSAPRTEYTAALLAATPRLPPPVSASPVPGWRLPPA